MKAFIPFRTISFRKPLKRLLKAYRDDPTQTLTPSHLGISNTSKQIRVLRFLEDNDFIKYYGHPENKGCYIILLQKAHGYFEERKDWLWRSILAGVLLPFVVSVISNLFMNKILSALRQLVAYLLQFLQFLA